MPRTTAPQTKHANVQDGVIMKGWAGDWDGLGLNLKEHHGAVPCCSTASGCLNASWRCAEEEKEEVEKEEVEEAEEAEEEEAEEEAAAAEEEEAEG
jgi:hypothetical protein